MTISAEGQFRRQFLYSAAVVTSLRLLHVGGPGNDLGAQIQAAYNLLAGRGLSVYQDIGFDLTDAAGLATLTVYPSGYSLVAAALFGLGLDVGSVVKLLGAAGTMTGWWGWARLGGLFCSEGLSRGGLWKAAARMIPTATPMLFTPSWEGTDIFLWAATPWALEWIVRASNDNTRRAGLFDCAAGVLCGLSFLIRYASLFVAVYCAAIILWQSGPRLGLLMRRWGLFAAGIVPAIAFQFSIDYLIANSPAKPGGLSLQVNADKALERLLDGISQIHTANYMWAFWFPGKVSTVLLAEGIGVLSWRFAITLAGLCALALAVGAYGVKPNSRDLRPVSLGLFVVIPTMLLACMIFGNHDYVGDVRYYLTVVPLSVFVVYSFPFFNQSGNKKLVLLQACGGLYLTAYVALTLLYLALMLTPTRLGTTQREKLMAAQLHTWPSFGVVHELSPARRLVIQLLAQEPDAVLLTSQAWAFAWDPAIDHSKVHTLSCYLSKVTQVTGPARIVIHTFDMGSPETLSFYSGNGPYGRAESARCFDGLPNIRLVQRFPEEGLKVLDARVDSGQRVVLNAQSSR